MRKTLFILLILVSMLPVRGQDFIEDHEFKRTFQILYGTTTGTAFLILHNNKNYWVTARHIFDKPVGTASNKERVRFFLTSDSAWLPFTGTLYLHSNPKVDIAIISLDDTTKLLARSINPNVQMILGDEGFFLGYPYGLRSKSTKKGFPFPLVKKFTFSGQEVRDSVQIFYLDGHNNPGFSGGPVYLKNRQDPNDKRDYLIGVVSAYILQKNELTTRSGEKINYQENSGIIIVTSKEHILEILSENRQ